MAPGLRRQWEREGLGLQKDLGSWEGNSYVTRYHNTHSSHGNFQWEPCKELEKILLSLFLCIVYFKMHHLDSPHLSL